MAEDKEESEVKLSPKKNNKNIVILIILLVVSSVTAILFFIQKPAEIKETIAVVPVSPASDSLVTEVILPPDSIIEIDSISVDNDTIEIENIVISEDINKKTIKKVSKFKMDNNPKYWIVVKSSAKDTTFYTLKNRKTGTKLSNKYFSKEKAKEELNNFRNIISK